MIDIEAAAREYNRPFSPIVTDWPHRSRSVTQLSREVNRLVKLTRDEPSHPVLEHFTKIAKNIRWQLNTTLIGTLEWERRIEIVANQMNGISRLATSSFDNSIELAMHNVETALADTRSKPNASLLAALTDREEGTVDSETIFVTVGRKEKMTSQEALAKTGFNNKVCSVSEVARLGNITEAIFIGTPLWFDEHAIACGRFAKLSFLHYAHLPTKSTFYGIFGPKATSHLFVGTVQTRETAEPDFVEESVTASLEAMQPTIDWLAVRAAATPEREDDDRKVSASLAYMEGGYVVWLEVDGTKRLRRIHHDRTGSERIELVHAKEINTGDYLLLRAGDISHEDYRGLVDRELGTDAAGVRGRQHAWKAALRDKIDRKGAGEMIDWLKRNGSTTSNIFYWAHTDSIRPRSDKDFALLLKHLGMQDVEQHLSDGRRLWNLHRQIGTRLADDAERDLLQADMTVLSDSGFLEIGISTHRVRASFIVSQVTALDAHPQRVPNSLAQRAIKMKGRNWLR
jgi:hypothetical protein